MLPPAEAKLSKNLTRGRAREEVAEKNTKAGRRAFFKEAPTFSTLIVSARDKRGRTFLVGSGERGDSRMMFTKGDSAAGRSLGWAVEHLKEVAPLADGSQFLDIGAEIGITAVLAIREHGFNKVIALEPNPGMYRLLCANGALNELPDQVEAVQVEPTAGGPLVLRRGKRWCDYTPASEEDKVEAVRKGKAVEVESASLDELAARDVLDTSSARLVRISPSLHSPAAVLEGMRDSAPGAAILLELDARVLEDPSSVAKIDAALAERFDGKVKLTGLSEEGVVSHSAIAELTESGEQKTASVLALGA